MMTFRKGQIAFREFNHLRRNFFRRLYEIASEYNGAFITDGAGTDNDKYRSIAQILKVIRKELKYKLDDKVPLIGINRNNNHLPTVKVDDESHIMLLDNSNTEFPTRSHFRLAIENFLFEYFDSDDATAHLFSVPPPDLIDYATASQEKTFLHMPIVHFLIGGDFNDFDNLFKLFEAGKYVVVVTTEQAEKYCLAGFVSMFVKKSSSRHQGRSDVYDNQFYKSMYRAPFIRKEMDNCGDKLETKLIRFRNKFERLERYFRDGKIILLDMDDEDSDTKLVGALEKAITKQLEMVITTVGTRDEQEVKHYGSRRIAFHLLAAIKMWRLSEVDTVEKLQFDIKDMLATPDQYRAVGKQLFQQALERHHSKDERLLIVRTLLNKNFVDYFKIEEMAGLQVMLNAFLDATDKDTPLVYCQLDNKFNDFAEIADTIYHRQKCTPETLKTGNTASISRKRLLTLGQLTDDEMPRTIEDYFVRQLRKNFNVMVYGKRRLKYNKQLDAVFRTGSLKRGPEDAESGLVSWSESAATKALVFWCIITDNTSLLNYFWEKSESPVMSALVITAIYRSLASMEGCDNDTMLEFQAEAKLYEQRAYDVFKVAHDTNWREAEKTLTQEHDDYHQFSVLEMAGTSSSQQFLSHPGVWNKINEIWTGRLKQDTGCVPSISITGKQTYIFDWSMQLIFICLFAYMLLQNMCHTVTTVEYFLFYWVISLLCEEGRQMFEAG